MGKRVCLVLGLVVGLLAPAAPVAGVAGFGDVEPERYYTEPVQWMVDDHIVETDNSTCFAPDIAANRGDTALYVWRMRGQPGAPPHPFEDVIDEDRNKAVSWMYANNITTGKTPTAFAPNDTLTRGEVAAFLHRLAGRPHATSHPFVDVTAPWQQQPVAWMFRSGITTGTSPTTYSPDEPITRGQLATFLYRYKGEPPVSIDPASPDCNEFTAVAAGYEHSCGLRTDQTIACWGANNYGESNPPVGQFTAVSAYGGVDGDHSCGIRTDKTVTCWGDIRFGQAEPPVGQFTAVTTASSISCGIRTDNTITCWGSNLWGLPSPPVGQFTDITAGASHACGLRTDQTIACWGSNFYGESSPPAGQFTDITAGYQYSCGLRADRTITCWGHGQSQQTNTPNGLFTAITTGGSHSCGLRTDNTISCWGYVYEGATHAPNGQFKAVGAGGSHSCGLRTDNTILCWGQDYNERTDAPIGKFTNLTMGDWHSCGIRSDNTLACWGDNTEAQAFAPSGRFISVATGHRFTCGLRIDNTIACWGSNLTGETDPPSGQFTALASGTARSCGIRTDNTLACWGQDYNNQTDSPDGRFTDVTIGYWHSCALRTDKTITCWGDNIEGRTDAPSGQFTAITTDGGISCGLRTDMTITCWGPDDNLQTDTPSGRFTAITGGQSHSCGLRIDKTVACWGYGYPGQPYVPSGQFSAVSAGGRHSCGLRIDKTVTCWGYDYPGQPYAPSGEFSAVFAGGQSQSCGLHIDGTLTCWGFALAVPMPIGVRHTTGADPDMCRPFGGGHLSPGFPHRGSVEATRTVRVAVLFVDFPDAEAEYSTRHESRESLRYAEQYLEAGSYGKLDIEFVPLHRWLRVENNYGDYLGSVYNESESISEAAARLADPEFDFSGIDVVMTVGPGTHFDGANAGGQVTTDEGSLTTNRINLPSSWIIFLGDGTLQEWGHAATHELAHSLGLADLYDARGSRASRTPEVANWPSAEFGLMGFNVLLPPEYGYRFDGGEMLAWNRWLLGWLDPAQIRCITEPEATVDLTPVADPGDGTAMAAIPLSRTEVIVVESRRRFGYDSDISQRLPEGVLVYTVDAALATGALPIKGANETTSGFSDESPFLTEGQSITVAGYTITLLSDDGETHTVKISRTSTENVGQGLS